MILPEIKQQRTLRRPVHCTGIGVHTGLHAAITLRPAAPDSGYVFRRLDRGSAELRVDWRSSGETALCTQLTNADGVTVMTIEHLMAALAGLGIDNCLIDMIGPEVPIMDGSARPFVALIEGAGIVVQAAGRQVVKLVKTVSAGDDDHWARLEPHDEFAVAFEIAFDDPAIGRQRAEFDIDPEIFAREIGPARTFGFAKDAERLRAAGRAVGASLENAVVVDEGRVLNLDGLRFPDEFVRHKILDAIGDLALVGRPLVGRYTGYRSSHALNRRLVSAVMSDADAWVLVPPAALDQDWREPARFSA